MSETVIYYQFQDDQPLEEYPAEIISLENIKQLGLIFGDLHGNWLKIVKVLVRYNILQLSQKDYSDLVKLYKTIFDSFDIEELSDSIQTVVTLIKNSKFFLLKDLQINIQFIGDTLAERGANDGVTIFFYQFLQIKQLGCVENLSNHNLEFIWNHLQGNFDKNRKLVNISSKLDFFFHHSLYTLKYCLHNNIFTLDNINELLKEFYYPTLTLFSYRISLDNNKKTIFNIFGHGPFLPDTIIEFAILFKIEIPKEFKEINHLAHLIDNINAEFKKTVAQPEELRCLIKNAFTPLSYQLQFVYKKPEDNEIKLGPNDLLYIYLHDDKVEYAVKSFLTDEPKRILISEEEQEQLGEHYQTILDILHTQPELPTATSSLFNAFFEIAGPKGYPDGVTCPPLRHPLDKLVWQRIGQIKEQLQHISLEQHQSLMSMTRHFKIALWYGHDLDSITKSDKPLPYVFNCLDNTLGKPNLDEEDPYGLFTGSEKFIVSVPSDTQLNEQCKKHFSLYNYPEDAYQWLPDNIDENFAEHCLYYAKQAEEILSTAKKCAENFRELCEKDSFDEKSLNVVKDLEKFASVGHEFIHYLQQYMLIISSKKIYYYDNYFKSHFAGKEEDKIKIEIFYTTIKQIETIDSNKLFTRDTRQHIKSLLNYSMPSKSSSLTTLKSSKIWPAQLGEIINKKLLFQLEDQEVVQMVSSLISNDNQRPILQNYLLSDYPKENLKKFLGFLFTYQPVFYKELYDAINKTDHNLWREVTIQHQKLLKKKLASEKLNPLFDLSVFSLKTIEQPINEIIIEDPKRVVNIKK